MPKSKDVWNPKCCRSSAMSRFIRISLGVEVWNHSTSLPNGAVRLYSWAEIANYVNLGRWCVLESTWRHDLESKNEAFLRMGLQSNPMLHSQQVDARVLYFLAWTYIEHQFWFGAVEGLMTVFQLRASAASHASYASHASQFVPRTAQSEQLGKSYHHLSPIAIYHPILRSFWHHCIQLRVTSHHGFNQPSLGPASSPMASQILSYERHRATRTPSAIHLSTVRFAEERLQCAEHTITVTPWGLNWWCAFVMCVMRSMKSILSKHPRPTAMPHPQTQLPLLVAYFGGRFFWRFKGHSKESVGERSYWISWHINDIFVW